MGHFPLLFLSLFLAVIHGAPIDTLPVCVVGAGPAGLATASRLEGKGQSVVLFEKQATVGGKCQSVYDTDGTWHPLGALIFVNGTYTNTLPIIDQSGVLSTPFTAGAPVYEYNITNGTIFPAPAIPVSFEVLLAEEFARYSLYWETIFEPSNSIGYKNGIPSEFLVTTTDWVNQNNFLALPDIIIQAMVAYGYGDPSQVPVLYILQYLTPDILYAFTGLGKSYVIDYHAVFTSFSKTLKGPVNLSTNITRIDRSTGKPIITYTATNNSYPKTQSCSSLVLAFPPTLSALQAANLDLSPAETEVFSPVGITNYYGGAVRLSQAARYQLYTAASSAPALPPPAIGAPVAFLSLWPSSDIATTWSWDAYRQPSSVAKTYPVLKQTLSELNHDPTDPNSVPVPVTDADVLGFVKTDYFPHFDLEQLEGGWYAKLDQLQGQMGTYYASGLNGFETVEFAIRAGYDVVDSYIFGGQ